MEPTKCSSYSSIGKTTEIFEAARDRFLDSLEPADRLLFSPCASAEDFVDAIRKLDLATRRIARRGKSLKCVYSLTKRLQPYFEVVNIFIQLNLEFIVLFWGVFWLVLQVRFIQRGPGTVYRTNS